MKYISTRGSAAPLEFEEIVTAGLAEDGGLYVPETIPQFSASDLASFKGLSYTELASKIMLPFIGSAISENDLKELINKSYKDFRADEVAPLQQIDDSSWVLELFHGPTLAFKDFALQFLGNLLEYLLEKQNRSVVVIGATSGDTGSAAIEGCKRCPHINLFMLHPNGRVSDVQRRQMTTVDSPNIHNMAIDGNFDDCQDAVKEMFGNNNFTHGKSLVAVNSINWVRIMAQIVYYFYSALKFDKPVTFSVPTGNFGDIFAGYIAHKMGLPIKKLIVATNQNDILHRFFTKNDYSKNGVVPTYSPSMDIQVSSNFERLLFDLYNNDGQKISQLMDKFKSEGKLSVTEDVFNKTKDIFSSHSSNDDEIQKTIKGVYKKEGYIIDPHTATGVRAAQQEDGVVITLATAHPAKFPDVIEKTIGLKPELPEHLYDLIEREEKYTELPNDIGKIKGYILENI